MRYCSRNNNGIGGILYSVYMLYTVALSLLTVLTPTVAHANCGCESDVLFCNPIKYCSVSELITGVTNGVTLILMPIIVLAITYIGFRMVLAGREKNADYTKWKNAFGWSLVGLFLVLGTRGVLFVIQNTVNDLVKDDYQVEAVTNN